MRLQEEARASVEVVAQRPVVHDVEENGEVNGEAIAGGRPHPPASSRHGGGFSGVYKKRTENGGIYLRSFPLMEASGWRQE
jgi:hypothetical protein